MRATIVVTVIALPLLLGGCSKDKPAAEGESAKSAAAAPAETKTTKPAEAAKPAEDEFAQPVLTALKQAGLTASGFERTAARPYTAKACVQGEVDKLEVVLCRYESGEQAKAAKDKLEQFAAGAVTGAVRAAGAISLAVADRAKADLDGKRLDKILKAFGKTAP